MQPIGPSTCLPTPCYASLRGNNPSSLDISVGIPQVLPPVQRGASPLPPLNMVLQGLAPCPQLGAGNGPSSLRVAGSRSLRADPLNPDPGAERGFPPPTSQYGPAGLGSMLGCQVQAEALLYQLWKSREVGLRDPSWLSRLPGIEKPRGGSCLLSVPCRCQLGGRGRRCFLPHPSPSDARAAGSGWG